MGLPDDVKLSNNVNTCKRKDHLFEPLPPPPAYLILPNVPNLRLLGRPVSLGPKSNWFKHEQFIYFWISKHVQICASILCEKVNIDFKWKIWFTERKIKTSTRILPLF